MYTNRITPTRSQIAYSVRVPERDLFAVDSEAGRYTCNPGEQGMAGMTAIKAATTMPEEPDNA